MSVLLSVLGFALAIGLLVAVHEYGHFQVARWCGVKVLTFSVGFGKPLWTRRGNDGVEYRLASIPLGGYVKMLDEREGEVDPSERHLAFNTQSVWKRIAIVVAGPLANFLFAIAAWWLVFVLGVAATKPEVGILAADALAYKAGVREGDIVLSVDGEASRSWEDVRLQLIEEAITQSSVAVQFARGNDTYTAQLPLQGAPEQVDIRLGLQPWQPKLAAVVGQVQADSAAERAGLLMGDRIVSVDGDDLADWSELVAKLQASPAQLLDVEVERDGRLLSLTLIPQQRLVNTPDGEQKQGFVGIGPHIDDATRTAFEEQQLLLQYGPIQSLGLATERTASLSWLTLGMLGKMLLGQASLNNIGGPVQIAAGAGATLAMGLTAYLGYLALISISLGVLNLLPVPVLDGGHLLYYLVELIKGSPVSLEAQAVGQRIGLAMLLMLMGLAFYNDFTRIF